jgi:transcriptional regulator with XRE-family HTH domain
MSTLSNADINARIGLRLAAVRCKEGLIQHDFAQRLGLSTRAYHNYERGEREIPAAALTALYEAFRVDPLWVLIGPGVVPMYANARPDAALVHDISLVLDQWLARRRKRLSPAKRALLMRRLYEHFLPTGIVDANTVNDLASLAA